MNRPDRRATLLAETARIPDEKLLPPAFWERLTLLHPGFALHASGRVGADFPEDEEFSGRAVWALGQVAHTTHDPEVHEWACRWFDKVLSAMDTVDSPRAMALATLGACAMLRIRPDHQPSRAYVRTAGILFERLLSASRRPDWTWFEAVLGYDNPRLSQALIDAGEALDVDEWRETGLESLFWIARNRSTLDGSFCPIGKRSSGASDSQALPMREQVLEAHAAIDAARTAYKASGDPKWIDRAEAVCAWLDEQDSRELELAWNREWMLPPQSLLAMAPLREEIEPIAGPELLRA